MKPSFVRLSVLAPFIASWAIPLPMAQERNHPNQDATKVRPFHVVRGEATFLERIALPPNAMLHVSLVGRVAGAEYLPLATAIVPAKNGATPFQIRINRATVPVGPYRLQAWFIADNRSLFVGRDAKTRMQSFDSPANIALKVTSTSQNIDGIDDGTPLASAPQKIILRGTVSKLDRRALSPDSRIEIQVRETSPRGGLPKMIVGQVIHLEGKQLPKAFSVKLTMGDVKPNRRYALTAKVIENGKSTYSTKALTEVTTENLAQSFMLRVVATSSES